MRSCGSQTRASNVDRVLSTDVEAAQSSSAGNMAISVEPMLNGWGHCSSC